MSVWIEVFSFDGIGGFSKEERLTEAELRNNKPVFSGTIETSGSWVKAYENDLTPKKTLIVLLKKASADHLFMVSKSTPTGGDYAVLFEPIERLRRLTIEYSDRVYLKVAP